MLKSIFTPSDCAKCRLCCNFTPTSVWESPFLTEEQARSFRNAGVELEFRSRGGWSFAYHFDGKGVVNCPMLDPDSGCSLSPEEKPFECSIWPLRLMERDGRLLIGRYRDCPAIQGEKRERLDTFARGELLETLLAFVRRHPDSLRPFSPVYEIIWEGELP